MFGDKKKLLLTFIQETIFKGKFNAEKVLIHVGMTINTLQSQSFSICCLSSETRGFLMGNCMWHVMYQQTTCFVFLWLISKPTM